MKFRQPLSRFVHRVAMLLGVAALVGFFAIQSLPASAAPAENAFVRVVHASPVAGDVDVFVDGSRLLEKFAFGTVTDYVPLAAGPHEIQVAPAGKGIGAAVIKQSVTVEAGMPYTVAAIGNAANELGLQAFVDNNLVSGDQAKVRVYHLSPDAGPVNVAAGGQTAITGLGYKNASDYLMVPAGSYTFEVTATDANAKVPVSATINAHTVNSVFAVGLLKGSPKLEFKLATVQGVPGMPGTGSDPNAAQPANAMLPWLLGIAGLALIGTGVAVRRFAIVRQK